jgi:hypothetical protein
MGDTPLFRRRSFRLQCFSAIASTRRFLFQWLARAARHCSQSSANSRALFTQRYRHLARLTLASSLPPSNIFVLRPQSTMTSFNYRQVSFYSSTLCLVYLEDHSIGVFFVETFVATA